MLPLVPANAIGGSPVFPDNKFDDPVGAYQAGNIFNQQSGAVDMSTQSGFAWFPAETHGTTDRFLTIDLGASYVLSNIEIFNSNQADRGTAHFSVSAGNSVSFGGTDGTLSVGAELSGAPSTLIPASALTFSTANPVTGQDFAISDPNGYRYLKILLIDSVGGATPFPGLAEVRITGTLVPEPSSFALICGGLLLSWAGSVRRRRA